MGYDAIIREGIGIINNETSSLQTIVTQYPYIGDGGYGKMLGSGILISAIHEPMNKMMPGEVVIKAKLIVVSVLEDTPAFPGFTRLNPVDPRDEFELPGGVRGVIVDMPGLTDPTTTKPYFYEIFIGESK